VRSGAAIGAGGAQPAGKKGPVKVVSKTPLSCSLHAASHAVDLSRGSGPYIGIHLTDVLWRNAPGRVPMVRNPLRFQATVSRRCWTHHQG